MKVQITSVQTLDDKVYFPGEVEVPEQVGKRLQKQMQAKEEAVAATGNPEAAPMTKDAAGPDVGVGAPVESGKKGSGSGGKKSAGSGSSEDEE